MIYLDHAATTPLDDEVFAAMEPYLRTVFGNPSEPHAAGREARAGLDRARAELAGVSGVDPAEVVFTGGGSEADAIAILGRVPRAPGRLVVSAIEHPAVRETVRALAAVGHEAIELPVTTDGVLDLAAADASIRSGDLLVCCMWANNVTGVVQPIAELADICAERDVPLHVDAVQAASGLRVTIGALPGAVTVALAAHKLGGPKGVGALVGRGMPSLAPPARGGGQEGGLRPGTENVAGAVALATAFARRQGDTHEWGSRAALRDRFERVAGLPAAGAGADRLPGHSLLLAGVRGDVLVSVLDGAGICAAAGSACAAGETEPSYVLSAMGIDTRAARTALRVSLGPSTSAADIDALLAALARHLPALRAASEAA